MTPRTLLWTRVGTRILGYFLLSAVLPICLLAWISLQAVTRQIREQGEEQLTMIALVTADLLSERTEGATPADALRAVARDGGLRGTSHPVIDPEEGENLCVAETSSGELACLGRPAPDFREALLEHLSEDPSEGRASFRTNDGLILASWHFVGHDEATTSGALTVVASKPDRTLFTPAGPFRLQLLVLLAVVLALTWYSTNRLVSGTLEPLAALSEGASRVARLDLTTPVQVTSNDEFRDLAEAFNTMADRVRLQFRHLDAAKRIDRTVIEARGVGAATDALIEGLRAMLPVREAAVLLFDVGTAGRGLLYHSANESARTTTTGVIVSARDLARLPGSGGGWVTDPASVRRYFRGTGIGRGRDHVFATQLVVEGGAVGLAAFTTDALADIPEADLDDALQLLGKASVAFDEIRLRRELEEQAWEALRALGNAIDAKSKWTSGHSQRVTDLSYAIGVRLGLDDEELDTLFRGGLLHDIGKVGVPIEILDHPGALNPEMRRVIEEHPVKGTEILGAVRAFGPLLPIVRHHHERWDGLGYPDRLAGEDIPRLARIVAVADGFDAMRSARPYRAGMPLADVMSTITSGAGTQFDPEIVAAFEQVIADGWVHEVGDEPAPLVEAFPERTGLPRILLVDDDPHFREALLRNFRGHRDVWEVVTAGNGDDALRLAADERVDVVVTDMLMPEKDGIETVIAFRRDHPATKIVAMSGGGRHVGKSPLQFAEALGAHAILVKPFEFETLRSTIEALLAEDREVGVGATSGEGTTRG